MPISDVHALLRERLAVELTRPELARLYELSGGNPFFALELARSPAGTVPQSLRDLLGDRVAELHPSTIDVLLLAAALARPTEDLVCAAYGDSGGARSALAAAGDVIRDEDGRLRFTHPLLASLCYDRAAPSTRRDAHRRLATAVDDVEERARHLALATTRPDVAVARALDAAAAHAAARGATVAAAELADLAAARTPADESAIRRQRQLTAAELLWLAGDLVRATQIHDELIAATPPGVERADLLRVAALSGGRTMAERASLCEQGAAEADPDDARVIELLGQAAIYRSLAGGTGIGLARARDALGRAQRFGDPRLLVIAQGRVAYLETHALTITPGLLEEALAGEAMLDVPLPFYMSPRFPFAVRALHSDDPGRVREILATYDADDDHTTNFAHMLLTHAEWELGNWDVARGHARAVREFADQTPDPHYRASACYFSALTEADVGNLDRARAFAEQGLELATAASHDTYTIASSTVLGHIELLTGHQSAAADLLRPLPERLLNGGHPHGIAYMTWVDTIEALAAVGEVQAAALRLEQYEHIAPGARGAHLITVGRARGLVAAARGDIERASALLDQTVASEVAPRFPFERARTLLALGSVQRRAGRRRDARRTLEAALASFERLGAVPWVQRAHDESRRVSGRRPGGDELTEAERRVAALAAEGLRNKEIAARLLIEVSTVEAHLSRVYSKLGLRSRTELATRLAAPGEPVSIV